ncbi:hypothetical protein KO465_05165 [Candidatus Micrarchaeota archaeon]|jgi:hypothetical protein|nr:hypothetical protein [Candidatus Micrarchaeota archaeon]
MEIIKGICEAEDSILVKAKDLDEYMAIPDRMQFSFVHSDEKGISFHFYEIPESVEKNGFYFVNDKKPKYCCKVMEWDEFRDMFNIKKQTPFKIRITHAIRENDRFVSCERDYVKFKYNELKDNLYYYVHLIPNEIKNFK